VCVSGDKAVAGLSEFETVNAQMAWHASQFSNELESRLREGLSALRAVASEIGAHSASAFLVKDSRTIRNLYMWPTSRMERGEVQLERAMGDVLLNFAGYASEDSPIARFLKGAFQSESTSFLLLSWGTDRLSAAIAFGFVSASAPKGLAASELPRTAGLAAVAAWSVYEVFRLHSELVVVNDRLGTRKLIERAKGMLQAEHGLDEQQAYAHLRRLSRQRRLRMSEIATDLLATARFP
jgi:ANTAR domain